MSVSMGIDWSNSIIEFHVSESLTSMTIVDGFALLNAGPQVARLQGIIWDVRQADLSSLDADALSAALKASPLPENAVPNIRIAAVAGDDMAVDVGRTWILVGRSLDDAERRVFNRIEDAREWVREGMRGSEEGGVRVSCT